MSKLQRMAQELAGHTSAGGEQSTTILYGVSTSLARDGDTGTWSYSKRKVLQTCILLVALTGAVLGTQYLVTKMRYLSAADHHSSELVLQAETQQFISHATAYRLPQIFIVGGPNATWKVPATPDFYTSWAAAISFRPGDVLRIIGGVAGERILQVPDADYAACTTTGWSYYWTFGTTYDIYDQLIQVATYNFVEGNAVQCIQGLKFSATVNPITVPAAPARPNVNAPNRQPAVFQVGGAAATWTIPASATFYEDWASNISFLIGDVLTFTFSDGNYKVAEVPYSNYEMCTSTDFLWYGSGSFTYQFTKAGIQYFVATTPQYCIQGMKFSVNVYENGSTAIGGLGSPASSPGGPSPTTPSGSTPSGSTPQSLTSEKPKTTTGAVVGGVLGGLFGLGGLAAAAGLAYKFSLCRNCSPHVNFCPNFHHHPTPEENQKQGGDDFKSKSKG